MWHTWSCEALTARGEVHRVQISSQSAKTMGVKIAVSLQQMVRKAVMSCVCTFVAGQMSEHEPPWEGPQTKDPANITLNQLHVSYAFAVLSRRLHGLAGNPFYEFEEYEWPSGYVVYLVWDAPRHPSAGTSGEMSIKFPSIFTPLDRERRGAICVKSRSLARAIQHAASASYPWYTDITRAELPHLRCTVHLVQRRHPLVNPHDWQQGEHGLTMQVPNPLYNPAERSSQPFLKRIVVGEWPRAFNWSLKQTQHHLLKAAGYPGVDNPVTLDNAISQATYFCIETCSATLSHTDWDELVREHGLGNDPTQPH
jgi:hypothetical protein